MYCLQYSKQNISRKENATLGKNASLVKSVIQSFENSRSTIAFNKL